MSEKDFEEYLIMLAKKFYIPNKNKKKSNSKNDDKIEKLLEYIFKKELISVAESAESSESSESSESEIESDHEAELSVLSESDHEKEEQSVKDLDINERNKTEKSSKDEDNYINDK